MLLLFGVLSIKAFGQIATLNKIVDQFEDKEAASSKYQELQKLVVENAEAGIGFYKNHKKVFSLYPEIYAKVLIEAAEGYNQLGQYSIAHTLVDSAQVLTKDSMIYYEALYNKGRFLYKEKALLNAFNTFKKCQTYFQQKDTSFLKKTNNHLVINLIWLSQQYEELNQDSFYLFLSKAEEIVSQPNYSNNTNKVNVLYTIGAHYARTYDTLSAFQYFDRASQIKVDFESLLFQNIAFEKGLVYGKLGLLDAAMQQHKISLDIATKAKDNYTIYTNIMSIGRLFYDIDAFKKAMVYYQKGHDLAKEIKDDYLYSDALANLGNIHLKIKNYEQAITYYQKSIMVNDSLQNKYSIVTNNLGIAHAKKGLYLYTEANNYNQKAYNMAKSLGFQEELANSAALGAIIALELENYPVAIQKSKEVLALQTQISQLDLLDIYKVLSKAYEAKGNYVEALKYHQLLKIEADSFFDSEKVETFAALEARFQNEKITIENQHLKDTQTQNKTIIQQRTWLAIATGISLIMLAIIAWILAQRNKQKQLINRLLKKEVKSKNARLKQTHIQLENVNQNAKSLEKLVVEKDSKLATKVAELTKFNKQIEKIEQDISALMQKASAGDKKTLYQLKRKLQSIQLIDSNYLKEFNLSLKNYDPIFFQKLVQQYPNLTQNELNHCAFIRLNMTMKEVADLMNITEDSVKKARYRLKKKIGLTIKVDLKKHLLTM